MRLEDVTAEIRPRSDWEAVDLGFAMVRRDFWRCWSVWWLAMIVPTLVAGYFFREMPLILLGLFWWAKPAGSRMVLFEISRRLFGEKPGWKSVFKELPKVWFRRFFYRFAFARFSPWLPVTLAVEDLEGLRKKAYRQRVDQLDRRGDGVIMWIYFLADLTAGWLGICLMGLAYILMPEGQDQPWRLAIEVWNEDNPFDIPLIITWTFTICMIISMSLTDLFVTGAGFGIYVNNRTWLEGWDVELAFKRLGQRLGKAVAILALLGCLVFAPASKAQDEEAVAEKSDKELITEVKSNPDFKVHSVTEKVPKDKKKPASSSPRSMPSFNFSREMAIGVAASVGGLLLAWIAWLIWTNRHAFLLDRELRKREAPPAARVVMGMEVSAESLPKDVPSAAWALWQQGRKHEALALLYRGTISKVIDVSRVEILESDTEGDCLRRVEEMGAAAHPGYFRGLTAAWTRLAYGGQELPEVEVQALCRDWPFVERRSA